jgi:hypothetical protein
MRTLLVSGVLAAVAASASAQVGETPPALDAVKWYNTPPLALEQLQGKAVLIEVFRTW